MAVRPPTRFRDGDSLLFGTHCFSFHLKVVRPFTSDTHSAAPCFTASIFKSSLCSAIKNAAIITIINKNHSCAHLLIVVGLGLICRGASHSIFGVRPAMRPRSVGALRGYGSTIGSVFSLRHGLRGTCLAASTENNHGLSQSRLFVFLVSLAFLFLDCCSAPKPD